MTNSMIPYLFVPGTKAKASEVNANFIAVSEYITNKAEQIISEVSSMADLKADKTDLVNEHTVNIANTDLNNYKTRGTYIFKEEFLPSNSPKNLEETVVHTQLEEWVRPENVGILDGVLIVTGDENSIVKQIWICTGENPEIFTREYNASLVSESTESTSSEVSNSGWSDWYSVTGQTSLGYSSYLKLPNGLIIQWGILADSNIVYPIAFRGFACPVVTKVGSSSSATRVDAGITSESLTGFSYTSRSGTFTHMNWIAIGF